jgi:hypothetical protein
MIEDNTVAAVTIVLQEIIKTIRRGRRGRRLPTALPILRMAGDGR